LEPLYNGLSHPNLMNIDNNCTMNSKQPPSYEDCINAVTQIYGVMGMDAISMGLGNFTSNGMMGNQDSQQQNMKPNHPRQSSMPSSMAQNLAIPTSSYTLSSLTKQRPSLPTSPTHMAAMRAAHQQKAAQMQSHPSATNTYDYPPMTDLHHMLTAPKTSVANNHTNMQVSYSQPYHYPTPPSQHSQAEATPQPYLLGPETYLTPSPESPGQWSSSSPHSAQSDWSEGISSPMGPSTNIHMTVSEQQKSQTLQQQSHLNPEAVFI
jgi:Notch-like protein